jgi:hypothetical protein
MGTGYGLYAGVNQTATTNISSAATACISPQPSPQAQVYAYWKTASPAIGPIDLPAFIH